jgi:hypothetical protein
VQTSRGDAVGRLTVTEQQQEDQLSMADSEFERAITAAFEAFNDRDFATFATYMTEDVLEEYPQSGEQLVGRADQRAMHEAFPDPPTFAIRAIRRDGALAVVELDEQYNDATTWKTALILELRDGLVAKLTGYFSEPFPAPEWRAPFRTRP